MNEPTKKQEEALREFLHSAIVPLIEDVLVKKLGQAMSYAKEQIATPKQWVGLTDDERVKCYETTGHYQTLRPQDSFAVLSLARAIEAKLKEKNT